MRYFGSLIRAILLGSGLSLMVSIVASAPVASEGPKILILGDSITAGYDLAPHEAYPALIQEKIRAAELPHHVINGGQSGDTTAGGLRRIVWLLRQHRPDFAVIALGGNDGLRGLPTGQTEDNLIQIAKTLREKNPEIRIIIAGMRMPESMGAEYAQAFAAIYPRAAQQTNSLLIPFLLEGVAGIRALNLPDQIHPNPAGQERIAETVWLTLEPLLNGGSLTTANP